MQQFTQTRWEYQLELARDTQEIKQLLQSRGAAGWELVNVVLEQMLRTNEPVKTNRNRDSGSWHLFFKRPNA
jgi:pantothenate kinase-related protein Tda10